MATVIGNVVPEDDYMHPLGPEQNFNESMYFNFFDRERNTGGFVRMGNRANEGYSELTTCIYLPDGRVLFQFKRPQIENNDAFDAGGMRVTPYASLNVIREFDGQSDFVVADTYYGSTSTKGTSGMAELGVGVQKGGFGVTAGVNWTDGGALNGIVGGQLNIRYAW